MEFFKKIFPEKSSKNIKEEQNPKMVETINDQINFGGGLTDVSIEDHTDELNEIAENRKLFNKEGGSVSMEESWEEEKRDSKLVEKLNELRVKYAKLKEEIKERQIILNELRYSKSGAERAVKNLNYRDMTSKERNIIAVDMMRGAEDRIERLTNKINKGEIEMVTLHQELGQIDEEMSMIAGLIPSQISDEDKTVGNQRYKFEQN